MESDILTIEEVARYLRVSERTAYEWAQKGEIPAGKIGTVWRFKRSEIERWVNEQLSPKPHFSSAKIIVQTKNILSPARVIFVKNSSKRDVLVELAENLAKSPQVKNSKELQDEILRREELMSTAIGRGIAIPHVRLSSVTDLVMSVGICKKPVPDFFGFDDEGVSLIFMIAAAYNQHSYYLQTLSHLSVRLKKTDLRENLLKAKTEEDAYALLINEEERQY